MSFKVRRLNRRSERDAAYALRHEVFVVEQGVPVELELDEHDETDAIHFGVEAQSRFVSTARLVPAEGALKFGRMVVGKEFRGLGIATMMLNHCVGYAFNLAQVNSVVLDAQIDDMGLYVRAGFVAEGERFLDAGIPHQRMRLTRPN